MPAPGIPAAPGPGVRAAFMLLGGIALLAGLDAALLRLGVWAPVRADALADAHGMIMALGFLGTVIAVERAQALGASWGYAAPGLLGAGAVALASGVAWVPGQLLLAQGAWVFTALLVALWRRAPVGSVAAQAAGVALAAVAASLWPRVDVSGLLPLLAAYFVITIAAERAGLAQLTLGSRATTILIVLTCWLVAASTLSLVARDLGGRLVGLGLAVTAGWLIRDDVARRLIRRRGLQRFNGVALLLGYAWLALAGVTWLAVGALVTQGWYDLVIHCVFVGFGLSMVLAHAPIIFPAVLARPLPYAPLLWVPLALLHAGMAVRVAGDVVGRTPWWQAGGVIQVIAALTMVLSIVALGVRGEPRRTTADRPRPRTAGSRPSTEQSRA